ncbi:ATP-binding protein [Ferrovibrio sp.]|uniref:ATP-binding protein n=1 Tax=Ferrovibrio sp. TaxID=1917215 RepID=UPI003D139ABA
MQRIEIEQILSRLKRDNPWWETGEIQKFNRDYGPPRVYLAGFLKLLQADVRRAVVLMGPRRVGKTVMLHHAIQRLLDQGVDRKTILYVPIDIPTYLGLSLERLLEIHREQFGLDPDARVYVIFDEIQYLKDWERHLKGLVDTYPYARFVVSGSAAAALRMKSIESGAGRFTHYLLPPLTFHEFADRRIGVNASDEKAIEISVNDGPARRTTIEKCNEAFVDYINFGGFPEAIANKIVQGEFEQFVASDILDKVLLNDIPSLYGVNDTHDLKRLFAVLAYNTGQEMSFEDLSRDSGISKNTIKKYIEYLESAFLIHRLSRLDQAARRFKRETHFKVYLTNPCLRAALFGPVTSNEKVIGAMAETALMSQWVQRDFIKSKFYGRWKTGEIDFVSLHPGTTKPETIIEVKWSDRAHHDIRGELSTLIQFAKKHSLKSVVVTTKTILKNVNHDGLMIGFVPTAILALVEGSEIEKMINSGESPRRWIEALMEKTTPSAD